MSSSVVDGLTSAVHAISLDGQVQFTAPANLVANPAATAGAAGTTPKARDDDTVVADLCAFLAEQPDKALRGVMMASFYQAFCCRATAARQWLSLGGASF